MALDVAGGTGIGVASPRSADAVVALDDHQVVDARAAQRHRRAEAAWVDTVVARSVATAERAKTCTPGYYNREGMADAKTRQGSFFFGAPTEYADILQHWRADRKLAGLLIRRAGDGP